MRLPPALLATLALASLAIAQNQYQKDVIALNPIGSWPLTGNANDVSGNGNNGSLINGVNFTSQNPSPIEAQNAIMLSGVDQYVSIPPSASFNLDNHHAMTAIVWVKTTNQGLPFEFVMGKASAGTGWVLGIDNGTLPGSGRFGLFFETNATSTMSVESTLSVADGGWHMLAATYDGSGAAGGVTLYLDGVPTASTILFDSIGSTSILNTALLTLGAAANGSNQFEGNLSGAAYFGNALSASQILQLGLDASTSQAILSQFAFGGGWYSAVYFSNTGTGAVSFPVSFTADNGSPLNVPALGGSSQIVNIPAGGSAILEAPNTGSLQQGYVSANVPPGVAAYGVFRQSVPGVPDQEAIVPLASANATNVTFAFDDTAYTTAVAIVNPNPTATNVSIVVLDSSGHALGSGSVGLPPFGKTEAALRSIQGLSQVAGARGTVQFTVSTNSVAVIGIRFNGTAFSSIPPESKRERYRFAGGN